MPNPRAQKQVTLDRVTEDLKSFSQPLTAIADMMAGALRGSTAATLGAPGDIREIVDLVAPDTAQRVLGQRSFPTTEEMKAKLPPVVPQGGLPVRQHTAEIYGGLGEFMPLPGSGAVAAGLGRAVKAVPGALRHGAQEFAKASVAGAPHLTVWHGTPHRFPPTAKNPLGEFDPSKIGTGEGAQAYGIGHYTAEAKDVGKSYQPRSPEYEQKLINLYNKASSKRDYPMMEVLEDAMLHKDPEELLQKFGNAEDGYSPAHLKAAEEFTKWYSKNPPEVGSLYKIDLPDEAIAKMLDWDKKFDQQHPDVQKAILKYWEDNPALRHYGDPTKLSGEGIYGSVTAASLGPEGSAKVNLNPSREAASMDLRHYGIPGIRYLDEGSRGGGQGTSNFVVFPGNEDLLTILERKKEGGVVNEKHFNKGGDSSKGEIKATPVKNPQALGVSKAIQKAHEFLSKPFGYQNPPGELLSELVGLPSVAQTLERIGYGEPLTTGAGGLGGTSRPRPEVIEAAMAVAPLAQMTKGMPVGMVIKPKGGNWLTGDVEKAVGTLKSQRYQIAPELLETFREGARDVADPMNARMIQRLREHEAENALNNWVDRNLTNYIKKEMATPEDPVRKLAEQGIDPQGRFQYAPDRNLPTLEITREELGFPTKGMGQSPQAQNWEKIADETVQIETAGDIIAIAQSTDAMSRQKYQNILKENPWLLKVDPNTPVYSPKAGNWSYGDTGFDHIIDVLKEDLATGRIRPEQLSKVSMEQAVRRTFEYDQEMAKKMAEAQIKATEGMPVYKEYPEGYKWIELAPKEVKSKEDLGDLGLQAYFDYMKSGGDEAYALKAGQKADAQKYLAEALKYEGDTMGHCVGGYCPDVLEGRSRIYSLRDAKGEPHVTVEVNPRPIKTWDDVTAAVGKDEAAKLYDEFDRIGGYNMDNTDAAFDMFIKQKGIQAPERIVQIKGKQNRAPKEEYLPYVQDFVKGGQWSDVGDFQNTGLRDMNRYEPLRKYLEGKGVKYERYIPESEFKQFEDDFLMDRLYPKDDPAYLPPTEGMKRGGKVSVSDNCDCQMMEVEDKKFGRGGLAKEGAEAVVKALTKQAAKEAVAKESAIKASEALGKIEGQHLGITQADRTKVGGKWLGGPGFSGLQLERPEYKAAEAVWGVKDPGTAKTILGSQTREGKPVVFTTMLGSPTQHQSNQMVFNELLRLFNKSAKEGNLDPDQYAKINERLRMAVDKDGKPVFPEDVDILSPNFKKIANTFDRRAIAGNIMGGVGVGGKKGQIFPYDKVIQHTTDPALVDAPAGSLGNRMFTLSGGVVQRPDLHPAFPTILQGEDLGVTFTPVMRDLVMKDFIEKTMKEKGRTPGYLDYTRGYPPTQLITEELLTNLQKQGYKKGGKVAKPMQKAKGGEIRAEDLSIEERPL